MTCACRAVGLPRDLMGAGGILGAGHEGARMSTPRPTIPWMTTVPPVGEKVIALTKWGVLVVGPILPHEWNIGMVVCWQRCPKKPDNWDILLAAAKLREQQTIEHVD